MPPTYNDPGARAGAAGAGDRIAERQWGSDSTAANAAPAGRLDLTLRDWRAITGAGALLGRAEAEFEGLVISDIAVFAKDGRRWAQLPAEPQRDRDGQLVRDDRGRTKYRSPLKWRSRELQDAFSATLIAAIERTHGKLGGGP